MLLALPKPIEKLLSLLDLRAGEGRLPKNVESQQDFIEQAVSATLDALQVLLEDKRALVPARRALLTLGPPSLEATSGLDELHDLLLDSDVLLGEEWGGFSRLLESALEDDEICAEATIRIEGLDPKLRSRLAGLQDAADALSTLQELATAFSAPSQNAAACLVLIALAQMLQAHAPKAPVHAWLEQWLDARGFSKSLLRAFQLFEFVETLRPPVLNAFENLEIARTFCLWFLARQLASRAAFNAHTRRLIETCLAKANLAPLSVFERAGLLT